MNIYRIIIKNECGCEIDIQDIKALSPTKALTIYLKDTTIEIGDIIIVQEMGEN